MIAIRKDMAKTALLVLGSAGLLGLILADPPSLAAAAPAVTLTTSASSAKPGGAVTLTAQSSGISNPEYQFWVQDPDGQWVDAQNYSSQNTFILSNVTAGSYLVTVAVLSSTQLQTRAWSDAVQATPVSLFVDSQITAQPASTTPLLAEPDTITASAQNIDNPVYQFEYVSPDGQHHMAQAFSTSGTWVFVPHEFGTYHLDVLVKSDNAPASAADILQSTPLTVTSILPQGATGPQGPVGPQGPQGLPGPQGPAGLNGGGTFFSENGTYTVPQGVKDVSVTLQGGGGGGGGNVADSDSVPGGGGGQGGKIQVILPVTPGEVLTVDVGIGGASGATDPTSDSSGGNGGSSELLEGSATLATASGGLGGGEVVPSSSGGLTSGTGGSGGQYSAMSPAVGLTATAGAAASGVNGAGISGFYGSGGAGAQGVNFAAPGESGYAIIQPMS